MSHPAPHEEKWRELAAGAASLSAQFGASVPLIGVADATIPLECLRIADRALTEVVSWPASPEVFRATIQNAMNAPASTPEPADNSREIHSDQFRFQTFTRSLFPVLDRLERAARHDFTILIVGETGTGKTTLAGLLHELSPRREERLLTVACGALPGDLIDSELFGHVRGSFTGADRDKEGKFEAAGDGSILLDEIDVLGPLQQAKLLRVLETGEYERVGSNETRRARCRTIVASNVSLERLVQERQFRQDLYYRLNQVKFEIPPLRDRRADIIPLAAQFIDECRREQGLEVHSVHVEMIRVLRSYSWPGNIRELRNEVRRAALFHLDGVIAPDSLSRGILEETELSVTLGEATLETASRLAQDVAVAERDAIEVMLRKQGFNRAATARALGISRVTLYNKLRKYRIDVDELDADG